MAEMDCLPQAQDDARIVMLIDDEPAQGRLITAIAARDGWRTIVAPDAETAIAMLGTREGMQLSAILLDQWVPGDDACALIAELKSRRPALPILMLTTSASPLLAVEAMRAGASDYLVKPVSPDRLMEALRSVTQREAPRDELAPLTEKMSATLDFDAMIGTAPSFRAALAQAAKAARGHGHVLIEGGPHVLGAWLAAGLVDGVGEDPVMGRLGGIRELAAPGGEAAFAVGAEAAGDHQAGSAAGGRAGASQAPGGEVSASAAGAGPGAGSPPGACWWCPRSGGRRKSAGRPTTRRSASPPSRRWWACARASCRRARSLLAPA